MKSWMKLLFALAAALFLIAQAGRESGGTAEVLFAPTGEKRLVESRLVQEIGRAQKQICVAMYQFTSRNVAEALGNARRRGVEVRVLVDGVQSQTGGPYGQVLETLRGGDVPFRRVYPEGVERKSESSRKGGSQAKFHHKYCVLDGVRVITGSCNWTVLADEENYENVVLLSNRAIAAQYVARFEEVWKNEKITEAGTPD